MKINMIIIVSILFVLLAVAVFAFVATQNPFPVFKYSTQTDHYVNVTQNVGPEDSRFMWNNNSLNLITQAFALFAAATATLAMLSTNKKEEPE
jgi:amino acid permease